MGRPKLNRTPEETLKILAKRKAKRRAQYAAKYSNNKTGGKYLNKTYFIGYVMSPHKIDNAYIS